MNFIRRWWTRKVVEGYARKKAKRDKEMMRRGFGHAIMMLTAAGDNYLEIKEKMENQSYGCYDAFDEGIRIGLSMYEPDKFSYEFPK